MKKNYIKDVVKENDGITLLALVLTIIVLIILAGISIGMLVSDNGIINNSSNASEETKIQAELEKVNLAVFEVAGKDTENIEIEKNSLIRALNRYFNNVILTETKDGIAWIFKYRGRIYIIYKNGSTEIGSTGKGKPKSPKGQPSGVVIENPEEYKDNDKVQTIADGNDESFVLPFGGKYIEGTVDTGIVIEYKGSQFVWIPINSDLTVRGTDKKMAIVSVGELAGKDDKGRTIYEGQFYDFTNTENGVKATLRVPNEHLRIPREPKILDDCDTTSYNTVGITAKSLQEEYDAMIESVIKYGGFYVGRYETSFNGASVASISGVEPMTWSTNNYRWYGVYQKEKEFTDESDLAVSGMIWGSQYDAMLNWVIATEKDKDKLLETTLGNHTRSLVECGSYENDKINNIYDLVGNLAEGTLEGGAFGSRIARGGNYNSNNIKPTERYFYSNPTYLMVSDGSRMMLHIK